MSASGAPLWIAGIGALLACAGCGFKGPLYLPERNATVVTHPAQGAQAAPSPRPAQAAATKKKSKTSSASQQTGSPAAPPQ